MKRFLACLVGLLCAGFVAFLFYGKVNIPQLSPLLRQIELQTLDYRMQYSIAPEVSPAIKIVLVDDVSDLSNKLATFIRLVSLENNGQFKPKVIGLNYRFDAAVNEELVSIASAANNVYYGYSFLFDPQQTTPEAENQDILPFRLELTDIGETGQKVFEAQRVELPAHKYLTTARSIGFVNTLADTDGVFRRIPLFLMYQNHWYGSLPLLMAMDYLKIESVDMTFYPGQYIEIAREDGGFTKIPVNEYGELLIDFAHTSSQGALAPYQTFSMEQDILANMFDPAALSNVLASFKDAIVLVGSGGNQPVPVSNSYPLTGMLANFINNIVTDHFLMELPAAIRIGIVMFVGALSGFVLGSHRVASKFMLALFLCLLYGGIAYGAYAQFHLILPVFPPALVVALTFLLTSLLIHRSRHPKKERSMIDAPRPKAESAEKKRKPAKTQADDVQHLEHTLTEIREDLDRKSYRLRSKIEELRLTQEEMDAHHHDHSGQIASLQKEIRAREIEIKGLLAKEEELSRQLENLPSQDNEGFMFRDASEKMMRVFEKHGVVARSQALLQACYRIEKLSKSSIAVLIQGEPGTGKNVLADIIREISTRHNRPMLHIVCDGDMDMLEDDLFGHRKGAFPGADDHRIGLLRKVDGGTLVLEEIGNLSLEIQTRLIQAARGKAVRPLGEDVIYPSDVRMIATTTKDLRELVSQGKFREDLYRYFSIYPILLPPLRDRKEDIPGLVAHFVKVFNRTHSKAVERVPDETINLLIQYDWPGNVRELAEVIERAVIEVQTGEKTLSEEMIRFDRDVFTGGISDPGMLNYLIALLDEDRELPAYQPLRENVLAEIQRVYCTRLLRRHHGEMKNAAIEAGLKAETFKKMLTELQIEPDNYRY